MTDDPCTCKNRALTKEEMVYWLLPNKTYFVTARDCPLHGVVLTDEPPAPVNHTETVSENSAQKT